MYEIYEAHYISDKEAAIRREFKYKSVVGHWGNKKTYIVQDVLFNKNPTNTTFINPKGEKVSVAAYFNATYKLKVSDPEQPIFLVRNNGHDCYLPPEFCLLDGVPDAIRKSADWINIQKTCRKTPEDKLYEITEFSQDFLNSKIFK
jgi:hypothetical protein